MGLRAEVGDVGAGVACIGPTIPFVMLGILFWGLHMGSTQGLVATRVADTTPVALRGTALGVFNLAGRLRQGQ